MSQGADVNAMNNYGMTSLHFAAGNNKNKNIDVVKFLMSKGADVNAKSDEGWGWTPLHLAAAYNKNVEVAKFLVSQGANVDAKNNDDLTPFDLAKEKGNEEITEYLSSIGAKSGKE